MSRPVDPLNQARLAKLAELQKSWERKKREKEAQNREFQDEKGRFLNGPSNPNYKLSRNTACKILIRSINFKQSRRQAGAPYGVSHTTVQKIIQGKHRYSSYSPGKEKMMELLLEVVKEMKSEKSSIT